MIVFLSIVLPGCKKQDDNVVVLNESYFIGQWTFRAEYQVLKVQDPFIRIFEFASDNKLMFNVIVDGVRQTIGWEFHEQERTLRLVQRDSQDFEIIRFSKGEFTAHDRISNRAFVFSRVK